MAAGPNGSSAEPAMDVIRLLAGEIGPRRPCSEAEARAGEALVTWLCDRGVDASTEPFRGYESFGPAYAVMLGMSLGGALLQGRGRRSGDLLGAAALGLFAAEGDLRVTPVSNLLSRQPSANVVATVAPSAQVRRRVCLCAHMDSSRSGAMFHPGIVRRLPALLAVPALSAGLVAAGPLLRRMPGGRAGRRGAIAGLVFALAMIAERELRGEDVAGASDNASGCGVVAQLACELADAPLEHTQVDVLISGCEESGMLGAQAHLRRHADSVDGTTFVNFDTVGGDVPLTYILREGSVTTRPASPRLIGLLEEIAVQRPEIGLVPARTTAGLPTDITPALARGHEAITLLAQAETIPHWHWPSDTVENIAPGTVRRALDTGRELLRRLDRAT